jgi:hypothetical protein
MAAAANEPSELEQQFEKLQQAINQHQHNKVIKLADTSELVVATERVNLTCSDQTYLSVFLCCAVQS